MNPKENKYLDYFEQDIIERVQPMLTDGGYAIVENGKIVAPYMIEWRGPWIHVKFADWHNCHYWSRVLFPLVFQNRYVPSPCFDCYKVVVMPRTVAELFKLLDMMERLDYPSKCGTEGTRHNTGRLYGGYFYNNGLMDGRVRYREIRSLVDTEISPDVPVILKRGCTEYEQALGPSDEWEITAEQMKLEKACEDIFVHKIDQPLQPDYLKARIKKRWIESAFMWGDKTYMEFTGGLPMFDPPVTYHE